MWYIIDSESVSRMAKASSSQAGTKAFVPEGRSAMVVDILVEIGCGVITSLICDCIKAVLHSKH